MGICFSKKKGSSPPCASFSPATAAGYVATSSGAPSTLVVVDPNNNNHPKSEAVPGELKMMLKKEKRTVPGKQEQIEEEESQVKKEIFIIKHRKSHSHDDRDRDSRCPLPQQNLPQPADADGFATATTTTTKACNEVETVELLDDKVVGAAATATTGKGMRVRTSSCNKEEVDAILIQCGRLSRSSSGKAASSSASCDRGRKYSGSKRSYDFDNCEDDHVTAASDDAKKIENNDCHDADGIAAEKTHHHRQRHRQSSRPSPSSQGRRRTPSRERNQQQQQRSSSRERRASRSPARRSSEQNSTCNATTATANVGANTCNATAGANNNRPGKMVSVPASISSLVMDKSNNGGEYATTNTTSIKRISVKRNVGGGEAVTVGSRSAASPRSQSPARSANLKGSNEGQQQQQQPSLSRSSSRKAEHSPCRRNPLSEIDPNSLAYPQAHNTHNNSSSASRVPNRTKRGTSEGTEEIVLNHLKPNVDNKLMSANCSAKERQQIIGVEEAKAKVQAPAVASGADCGRPQTLTRSRSSRRSRDLDMINPETTLLSDPTPSYTRLLLEDIQNFHHHNNSSTSTAGVSLPPCVTKACSILEAVADLNSATSSNLSCAFSSGDRKSNPPTDQISMNCSLGANIVRKSIVVESEVVVDDDLMEPSFHKYVTVRRGTGGALSLGGGVDMEDQESSSGSNSFVSGSHSQQHHWGFSSSSWEPNSADSTDCWTSRSNTNTRELGGRKRSDCDGHYQQMQSGGINGRGKLTAAINAKGLLHTISAAAST